MIRSIALVLAALVTAPIGYETVSVADRGLVDLRPFACTDTPRSSVIQRVCYDKTRNYMLISVRGTYRQFCGLSPVAYEAFVTAASMGQFYSQQIDARSAFECRARGMPAY